MWGRDLRLRRVQAVLLPREQQPHLPQTCGNCIQITYISFSLQTLRLVAELQGNVHYGQGNHPTTEGMEAGTSRNSSQARPVIPADWGTVVHECPAVCIRYVIPLCLLTGSIV